MNYHRRCLWPVDALTKNYHLFIKHSVVIAISLEHVVFACYSIFSFTTNPSLKYDLCLFKPKLRDLVLKPGKSR